MAPPIEWTTHTEGGGATYQRAEVGGVIVRLTAPRKGDRYEQQWMLHAIDDERWDAATEMQWEWAEIRMLYAERPSDTQVRRVVLIVKEAARQAALARTLD